MTSPYRVLIRRCDSYDPDRIAGILREGMIEMGLRPGGRVLMKPNAVIAHPDIFPHAFTRKEFLDGALSATRSCARPDTDIAVGERSGITIPTRWVFRNAGYPGVIRKHGARTIYFDEMRHVPVRIDAPGRLRDQLYVPQAVADCDFLINLPKFKAHPWCRLTLSLKNFIGLQDDRHRLVDHNLFLEHKIADLQSVIQPKFIAVDAISAGQKMMLTPTPFAMGVILMGNNSCAVDTVGCQMVNVDPEKVTHLKFASQRGLGPMALDQIRIDGDISIEELQHRNRDFQFCLEPIDRYFGSDTHLRCTVGRFPEKHSPDYCWGGCPGALQEAVHIFRGFNPEVEQQMGKIRYVVGKVEGPLELEPDERVIFAGDCTSWEGEIDGRSVKIDSSYQTAAQVDETRTRAYDMISKVSNAILHVAANRGKRWIRINGCPVSVAEHVHYLSSMGGIANPMFDTRLLLPVTLDYARMRIGRFYHYRNRGSGF